MRMLVLAAGMSIPPRDGYSLRCYHLASALARAHEVHLLVSRPRRTVAVDSSWDKPFASVNAVRPLLPRRVGGVVGLVKGRPYHVGVHDTEALRRTLKRLIRVHSFDVIYAHFSCFSGALASLPGRRPLLVLDQHNLDRDMWAQKAKMERSTLRRIVSRLNLGATRRFEETYYRIYDLVISVSEQDRRGTMQIPNVRRVAVVANGTDVARYADAPAPSARSGRTILFVGSGVEMNIQAVRWFVRAVLPAIRREIPDVELHVVGSLAPAVVRGAVRQRGVRFWGEAEDVSLHFRSARLFVAPFWMGSGSKLKVLEALAARCPVVATSAGVRGIDRLEPGVHAEVRDDAIAFAEKCVALLRDGRHADYLAEQGYRLVRDHYDWRLLGAQLEDLILDTLRAQT